AHNQSLPVGLEQCEIQADSDHVFLDRTTGDVSGRLSLCSVIEKILKKICICQKPRIPGKEGCKDWQDPVHLIILFFLVQKQPLFFFQHDPDNPCILPFLVQNKASFLSWFRKTNPSFKLTERQQLEWTP